MSQTYYKMKTTDAFAQGVNLIETIIEKMDGLNEWRRRFISDVLMLFLTVRGRVNFLQLGRYGQYDESTYRNGFEKDFDFLSFNQHLIENQCGTERILGFDPSYISKSGKRTPGLGYFYSGVAGRYKKGLEIGSIAVIDLQQNTAYHLEAIQTPSANKTLLAEGQTLIDHYANVIVQRADKMKQISSTLVVDAYFTKSKFIDAVKDKAGLEVVGRMRDDANARYLFLGKTPQGRGRPKQYDGKIDVNKIDKRRIPKVYENDSMRIYSAVVNSVGLTRNIKLAYTEFLDPHGQVITRKLFFSTDLDMPGHEIIRCYRARFQMEFLFRDAKQFIGLQHCQARSSKKIHFHINASLTAASLAKTMQRTNINKTQRIQYSPTDIKTELFNYSLLNRILSIYPIDLNIKINTNIIRSILNFGKIAA